jgi:hypothetical protein
MAQVWLSFDEIQQVFGCDAAAARKCVVANQWERRRCSDGVVRAQVPGAIAYDFFMLRYPRQPQSRPAMVNEFEAAMEALCRAFGVAGSAAPSAAAQACAPGREITQVRTAA